MNERADVGIGQRVADYVGFARLARRNALERLDMARQWPLDRVALMGEATKAWDRCRHYLTVARQLRSYL